MPFSIPPFSRLGAEVFVDDPLLFLAKVAVVFGYAFVVCYFVGWAILFVRKSRW